MVQTRSQTSISMLKKEKQKQQLDNPIEIIYYFSSSTIDMLKRLLTQIYSHKYKLFLLTIILTYTLTQFQEVRQSFLWQGYWVLLGVASSIGLGTGLHTFVLFLGPHIAAVTLAAYSCNGMDFNTHGPNNSLECKNYGDGSELTTFLIFTRVAWESFWWGFGTSLGELPPYFVARAASAAGQDDDEFNSIEIIMKKPHHSFNEKIQVWMYKLMQSWGFLGILLCASIPNPLFDLAGIICGHFAVPFMSFWGATFIGKAIVKSTIQTLFIIIIFSKDILELVLGYLERHLPYLHDVLKGAIDQQVEKFTHNHHDGNNKNHVPSASTSTSSNNIIGTLWNGVLILMIGYFVVSMVVSLANAKYRETLKEKSKKKR